MYRPNYLARLSSAFALAVAIITLVAIARGNAGILALFGTL
ncbi:MAG: hypothetical protein ACTHJR_02930 [Sphingomonas sp.]